jgi:hypothetical protein
VNPQLEKLFIKWARTNGRKKPDSEIGLRLLQQEFLNELQTRAAQFAQVASQQVMGAAGDETHSTDPVSRLDPHMNLLRNQGGMIDVMDIETEDSDFTELIRNKHRAMEEAGGDDLAAHIIHRDGEHASLVAEAPFQRTNPTSAAQGVLGNKFLITSGVPPVQIASWTGDNVDTTAVTCTFSVFDILDANNFNAGAIPSRRPFGVVNFGVGGSSKVEVDIGHGCQLTVGGSAVFLSVGLDNPPTGQSTMTLQGSLSFQATQKNIGLVRTRYIDGLVSGGGYGGNFDIQIVPKFARNVIVWRSDPTQSMQLKFQDANLQNIYTQTFGANVLMTTPIDLSGDIELIQLVGGGLVGGNLRLIFGLGL